LTRTRNIGLSQNGHSPNFAWKTGHKADHSYHHEYTNGCEKLISISCAMVQPRNPSPSHCALSERAGVLTAIVGTTKPERFQENARLLEITPVTRERIHAFGRWDVIAPKTWIGTTMNKKTWRGGTDLFPAIGLGCNGHVGILWRPRRCGIARTIDRANRPRDLLFFDTPTFMVRTRMRNWSDAIRGKRHRVVISDKVWILRDSDTAGNFRPELTANQST